MSVTALSVRTFAPLSVCRAIAIVAAALSALAAPDVRAQASPEGAVAVSAAQDHQLTVSRTVHPRIAYRGIPLEDNPVRVQATVFPGQVFHDTLGQTMDLVLGIDLDQRGSAGIDAGAAARTLLVDGLPALGAGPMFVGNAAGAAPVGPGASVGGAASGATRGLGSLITGGLMPILGSSASSSQQGGGP